MSTSDPGGRANGQVAGRSDERAGRFRGLFAIPPTPFDDAGNVDEASLRRCVDFCVAAWAHRDARRP